MRDAFTIEYEERSYFPEGRTPQIIGWRDPGVPNYLQVVFHVRYNGHLELVEMDLHRSSDNSSTAKPIIYPMVLPY